MGYKRKAHVLFLCTGNSCRSQMAEGYANSIGVDWVEAKSAGIEAHGKNPRAISIMAEDGVDISAQASTVVTTEMMEWADLLVSVCGHADENCPVVPSHVRRKHWPLEDPAKAQGTDKEIHKAFLNTRDEVKRRIESMVNGLKMLAKSDDCPEEN